VTSSPAVNDWASTPIDGSNTVGFRPCSRRSKPGEVSVRERRGFSSMRGFRSSHGGLWRYHGRSDPEANYCLSVPKTDSFPRVNTATDIRRRVQVGVEYVSVEYCNTEKHYHHERTDRVDRRESHQPIVPRQSVYRRETKGIRHCRLPAVASESDVIPARPEDWDSLAV